MGGANVQRQLRMWMRQLSTRPPMWPTCLAGLPTAAFRPPPPFLLPPTRLHPQVRLPLAAMCASAHAQRWPRERTSALFPETTQAPSRRRNRSARGRPAAGSARSAQWQVHEPRPSWPPRSLRRSNCPQRRSPRDSAESCRRSSQAPRSATQEAIKIEVCLQPKQERRSRSEIRHAARREDACAIQRNAGAPH